MNELAIRRANLTNAELMAVLTATEQTLYKASSEKPIRACSGSEVTEGLAARMKFILRDIGYKVTDEDDWQYILVRTSEVVKKYYDNLSIKDISLAFELLCVGELDEFLPKREGQPDRSHYQAFNPEYLCKVLNAYLARRARALKKVRDAMPKKEVTATEAERKEYRRSAVKMCVDSFLYYKYHGRMPALSESSALVCYNILASVGLADEIEVSLSEQTELFKRMAARFAGTGFSAGSIRRGQELKAAFDRMINDEIQLKDYGLEN
jgi:hypothetical protein